MRCRDYIENYLVETQRIAEAISASDVESAVEILYEAWTNGRRVFTCGNGGSASTATHFVCDLVKTAAPEGRHGLKAECLNDNIPLMLALVNDNGFDSLYVEQLKTKFETGDVLICISVHGGAGKDKAEPWSQNLLKAMRYASDHGGKTIGLSGFEGGPMKEVADACVVVPVDSTPLVESFHVVLEHLICSCLRRKIEES